MGSRAFRALLAGMAALVLLVGVLRANARYFYCPLMEAVAAEACCAQEHEDADAPAVDAPECCEAHRVGALPNASAAATPEIAASPLMAILPPCVGVTHRATNAVRDGRRDAYRRGPPRPGEARARMMVFLI